MPPDTAQTDTTGIQKLLEVMQRLRDPATGCPWDLQQNFKTVAPYTIEETYEFVDAVEQGDVKEMAEELGDVLFQVVFHAQMGKEAGLFDFDGVASAVADKMIERHPHVFGDRNVNSAQDVLSNWETDKAKKREAEAAKNNRAFSVLDGVASSLPGTTRAVKLQSRAARVGFDWNDPRDITAKVREELAEVEAEIDQPNNHDRIEDEVGDLLFVVINLARKLKVDPETALRRTNRKFDQRFRYIEDALRNSGRAFENTTLADMDKLWDEAKAKLKAS